MNLNALGIGPVLSFTRNAKISPLCSSTDQSRRRAIHAKVPFMFISLGLKLTLQHETAMQSFGHLRPSDLWLCCKFVFSFNIAVQRIIFNFNFEFKKYI